MPQVKFLGKRLEVYICADFEAHPGDIFEVSKEKLDQLLSDFPLDFEEVRPFRPHLEKKKAPEKPKG